MVVAGVVIVVVVRLDDAGSGDRGGTVSGFTGWNMGGIWVGGDVTLLGLVVG